MGRDPDRYYCRLPAVWMDCVGFAEVVSEIRIKS